jgi:GNAT superfamily N-acetyltransferase
MVPLRAERLDGAPPPTFDCGRDEQNAHLHERAWEDQQQRLSTTYLFHRSGLPAGYVTVCMDSLPLARTEREPGIRYQHVSALKLAQIGIDLHFQGLGMGTDVVAFVVRLAWRVGEQVGCRYVTLDAQPDLVPWYARQGFIRNELFQQWRREDAIRHRRDPERIAISMRYDLRRAP